MIAIITAWILVGLYWILMSFKNKTSTESESSFSRILFLGIMTFSFYLLFSESFLVQFGLSNYIFTSSLLLYCVGFMIAFIGLAFAVYSRYYIGKNWSGRIEIKKDHKLLTTGPYGITRHPIYTGLLLGIIGTILIYNQPKGLLALLFIFCAFSFKINKEEKFLLKQFPEYATYMKKVKRIIPFVY